MLQKLSYCVSLLAIIASTNSHAQEINIFHRNWIDFNKNGVKDIYEDPTRSVPERVEDLLSQMTLEEKSCQLATLYGTGRVLADALPTPQWSERVWKDGIANIDEQLNGVGRAYREHYDLIYPYHNHVDALNQIQDWFIRNTRLGIPVEFSNEGIHGLNHTLATPLPAPIAMGSTWDADLVRQAGRIVGGEARLLGYHSVYAPILDVARDQRWGRCLECYSEDPFLVASLGVQMSTGIQENGVGSCLKHYAAYSVPKGGRDSDCRTDPHITPRELHEIFLYPFKKVIQQAHPMEVMSSYNDWNGEPVSASKWFLTDLLRDEYGFDGYVVSDSEAVEFVYTKHQVAADYPDAVRQVLEAGLNVRTNFTKPEDFILPVRELVRDGKLSMDVVDNRVREVLSVKFRLGLFDKPFIDNPAKADRKAGNQYNQDFMLRTNLESIVLLKNDNNTLPLDPSRLKKVLVTGPLAAESNYMSSRYGPNGLSPITALDGIRDYLKGKAEVIYSKGCSVTDASWPLSEIIPQPLSPEEIKEMAAAVEAAHDADVIIAVMGQDDLVTGESKSRTSLDLPGRQRNLLIALKACGKPIILVLINGQPLTINWEDANMDAILETWFPGNLGGKALALTLFGENNPSGKMPITVPKSIGQIEYNFPYKKGSHNAQASSGNNGYGKTRVLGPLYPFGHGLSYSSFEYSNLQASVSPEGDIHVSATITNTSDREGTEVVQLYVRDQVSSVVTYNSVLRGFQRVSLKAGKSSSVEFDIPKEELSILDKNMNWTVESGEFKIMLGSSSTDIRLQTSVTL